MPYRLAAVLACSLLLAGGAILARDALALGGLPAQGPEAALRSLSFSPYGRDQDPGRGSVLEREAVARDVAKVAGVAAGIRTYAATGGLELVPPEAAGLRVALGAWIGRDDARNAQEIAAALALAEAHPNVVSLVVGNETLLRREKSPAEMAALIRAVRERTKVPVTTGEVWHLWLAHPELAEAADYIAVHILPFWEGVPPERAVEYAFLRYDELRRAYPDKRIVIAEFGWPSQGYGLEDEAGRQVQARVIRDFVEEAGRRGVDYNIIEAFDQPWKTGEGAVGPHWGLFDAERRPKPAAPVAPEGELAAVE